MLANKNPGGKYVRVDRGEAAGKRLVDPGFQAEKMLVFAKSCI